MTTTLSPNLAINKAYSALFRRFIPRNNILFLSFCPRIETPYGKDSGGMISDTIFMPSILRIPTAKFQRLSYYNFTNSEEPHIASGILLNVYKATSTSFVDRKFEIADIRYHSESMLVNCMIDALDFMENDLLTNAISQCSKINAINGSATSKTYLGGKITERSLQDELDIDAILDKNNARYLTQRIAGSLAFGTSPIPLTYIELTNVEASKQIRSTYSGTGNFITASQYADAFRSAEAVNSQRFEVGYVRESNRRIFVSNNFPELVQSTIDGGAEKVYHSLILSADAFYIYTPSNRFIETLADANKFTNGDLSADKIRLNIKLTYGLANLVYVHALHFIYLGKQTA